jgi:thioredoxin:protein disulfide reductase
MLMIAAVLAPAVSALAPAEANGFRDAVSSFGQKLGIFQSPEQHPFLDPEQAFMLSAEAAGGDRITVHFRVAEGYYLYRDMLGFRLAEGGGNAPGEVTLGAAELPTGRFKEDEFFGRMEVFYDTFDAHLPLTRATGARDRVPVAIVASFQGCAEAGYCYPPMTRTVELVLPPADNH